jgi:hypothetical protein
MSSDESHPETCERQDPAAPIRKRLMVLAAGKVKKHDKIKAGYLTAAGEHRTQ